MAATDQQQTGQVLQRQIDKNTDQVQHSEQMAIALTQKIHNHQQVVPLIPHVVHRAKNLGQAPPIFVANSIVVNYFGGEPDSDDSDAEGQEFVVHFGEQELYEELIKKYANILELPGNMREYSQESRRAWAERLETKSLRMARAAYRAQRDILKRRKGLAGKGIKASRQKSRMVHQEAHEKHDICQTVVAVANSGMHDLRSKFLHKPWWTLEFPIYGSKQIEPEPADYLERDVEDDQEEILKRLQDAALERISVLASMDSPRSTSNLSATNLSQKSEEHSSTKDKGREPALKTVTTHPGTFSTLTVQEFKELFAIRCAAMKVEPRQGNLQSFLHSITKGCSNTCFNLVDMGIEATSLNYLLKNLSNKIITLTKLNLACNPVGNDGATELGKFLFKNRTLRSLKLESALIGPAGQVSLFSVLQSHNFHIEDLDLGGSGTPLKNILGEAGALAASGALRQNTALSILSLSENRISPVQLELMSKGLAKNIQLTKLDLSNNVFGDQGVCALATALETLQLNELNLARTEMSDRGACVLAQALSSCRPPVHTLHLSGNRIAEEGAAAFASVLSHKNTVLSTLKLDRNRLGPGGAKYLAEKSGFSTEIVKDKYGRPVDLVVHYPRALTDLDLSDNGLKDEGAKFVAQIINLNTILTKLNVSHNGIGNKGMQG